MVINIYAKAYTEAFEIITHLNEEEYSKIPKEKIEFLKKHRDLNYNYKINPKEELSNQHISKEANAILITLFRDYFATEKQNNILNNLLNQNQKELEEKKREKYDVDVFKKDNVKNIKQEEIKPDNQLVRYRSNFFVKFINFIKSFVYKK